MESTSSSNSKVLEINLISAQNLKPPSTNMRRLQTYALVWIHPSTKLRTRLDRVGSLNPTWNDRFLFKVVSDFLSGQTSAVSFEIYAVGCLRDALVGTVRFLVSNLPACDGLATPSCIPLQIRRPSGRFHGVLNIGVSVLDVSDFPALKGDDGASAIGYRDLMGESILRRRRRRPPRPLREFKKPECGGDDSNSSFNGDYWTEDASDSADSTTSSTSSNASSSAAAALKDWNVVREFAGKGRDQVRVPSADGFGMTCGLFLQRRFSFCPSDLYRSTTGGGLMKENR